MTEFEKLVSDMRKAQKDFFRTHDYAVMRKAKELEKQVDQYLDEQVNGPDLFKELPKK